MSCDSHLFFVIPKVSEYSEVGLGPTRFSFFKRQIGWTMTIRENYKKISIRGSKTKLHIKSYFFLYFNIIFYNRSLYYLSFYIIFFSLLFDILLIFKYSSYSDSHYFRYHTRFFWTGFRSFFYTRTQLVAWTQLIY